MHYEINVAKMNKRSKLFEHYFATAKRSLTSTVKAIEVGKVLNKQFPFPEYDVTISCHSNSYSGSSLSAFLDEPKLLNY